MNKSLFFFLFVFTLSILQSDRNAQRYPWLENLEEARAIASAQKKPLLIVFRCEP